MHAPCSHDVRTARPNDCPQLVETLIKAFDTDPHIAWLVRSDAKRATAYRQFFTMMLYGLAQPHGEVLTSQSLNGVAVCYPPGRSKINLWKQALVAPQFIRAVGWNKLISRMVGVGKMEYHHLKEAHYYLQAIGVDPDDKGTGVGRALLKPILQRCDVQNTSAYLETSTAKNVSYYEGHGFRVIQSLQMPDRGPKLWLMKRTPRPRVGDVLRA